MSGYMKKRGREEDVLADSPKRLHSETELQILELLEDDIQQGEKYSPSEEVVNGVMRSLEKEIGLELKKNGSGASDVTSRCETDGGDCGVIDLDYLVAASDDELGIPTSPVRVPEEKLCHSSLLSSDFMENVETKGFVDNWNSYDDWVECKQFSDTLAWDVMAPGPSIDGNFSVPPWRLDY